MTSLKTELTRVLLLVGMILLGTAGCTDAQREANTYRLAEAKRDRIKKVVQDRATEYWLAFKWKRWSDASKYFEQDSDQVAFLDAHGPKADVPTGMDDVKIRFVALDETLERAEVRLSYTEAGPPDFLIRTVEETQLWYKKYGQWWVLPVVTVRPGPMEASGAR